MIVSLAEGELIFSATSLPLHSTVTKTFEGFIRSDELVHHNDLSYAYYFLLNYCYYIRAAPTQNGFAIMYRIPSRQTCQRRIHLRLLRGDALGTNTESDFLIHVVPSCILYHILGPIHKVKT